MLVAVALVLEYWRHEGLVGKKITRSVGYCSHVCPTDSCLYQEWLILWLRKESQRHMTLLFFGGGGRVHLGASPVL